MNNIPSRVKAIIIIVFFTTTILNAQEKTIILNIDDSSLPSLGTPFYFIDIVDKRKVKNNIGYYQSRSFSYQIQYISLEGTLEEELKDLIDKLTETSVETPEDIILFIHDLNISEWNKIKGTQSPLGHCILDIEYLKLKDSTYLSLGRYITEKEFSGVGMRKSHDKRLINCLKANMIQFMISDWKNTEGKIVQINNERISFSLDTLSKAGLYYNFNTLAKNEPLKPMKYKLIPRDKQARNKRYQLAFKDKKNRHKRILFIFDNQDLYVNSNLYGNTESGGYPGSYFIKAKHYGKYIYFVDKLPKKGASIGLGFTGSALSNYDRPMILDSSTGEFTVLNEELLLELLSDYPELIYDYKASDKWTKDIEQIIVKLNEKIN